MVDPVYKPKQQYQKLLTDHVAPQFTRD